MPTPSLLTLALLAAPGPAQALEPCCRVLELRQYTLHEGQRDALVSLFERELVESQEALGMRLVGQFRDAERPRRFVWLRGFRDLAARKGVQVLVAFERFESAAAYRAFEARLAGSRRWREELAPALRRQLSTAPQVLRLEPTARSQLR